MSTLQRKTNESPSFVERARFSPRFGSSDFGGTWFHAKFGFAKKSRTKVRFVPGVEYREKTGTYT